VRAETDAERIRRLMAALAACARSPGDVFFTGGATAVLLGWRESTIDVDLKLDPEAAGVFESLPKLKDELDINIELAAPDDFIPALPDWRERSLHIETRGPLRFFHYDLRAQALAKIERGHRQDLLDAREMLARGLAPREDLVRAFRTIEPRLNRYPAIDPDAFRAKLEAFLGEELGR
jgi:hypothetical protein